MSHGSSRPWVNPIFGARLSAVGLMLAATEAAKQTAIVAKLVECKISNLAKKLSCKTSVMVAKNKCDDMTVF